MDVKNWPVVLAGFVSLISLIGSIWYAAISFNNMHHSIRQVQTQNTEISTSVVQNNKILNERAQRIDRLEHVQQDIKETTMKVVYVSEEYVRVTTYNGEALKIPFVGKTSGLLTQHDGEVISNDVKALKELLVENGMCEDVNTCAS